MGEKNFLARSWGARILGVLLAALGLCLLLGGSILIGVGGSWYYATAGGLVLASGGFLIVDSRKGVWLYMLAYGLTWIWALWEVGLDYWPLVPRLAAPTVLGILVLLSGNRGSGNEYGGQQTWLRHAVAVALCAVLAAFGTLAFFPHGVIRTAPEHDLASRDGLNLSAEDMDWAAYGGTLEGRRFAPFDQITPDNVSELEVAWTFRTGDVPQGSASDQNTPIQIDDTVYTCSPYNKVNALDAETGTRRWTYDPGAESPFWQRCRSLGYYEATPSRGSPGEQCARRIVMATVDARLIEIDAETGQPCQQFGTDGVVDLSNGLGEYIDGLYFVTSPPTVSNGVIVVGSFVGDNVHVGEPSGVVRAFDAQTGEIVWAWDIGNPDNPRPRPADEVYTPDTPNVWSVPSVDPELGLIYLPTGNPTPDHWGALRSPESEAYGSAIVALDIRTGEEAWRFQTVHHDLWDYDVPSQPVLYDIPAPDGERLPALIQLTKRGEIFVLDRRTGEPIAEVIEKPVPQGGQAGDWTSPTQPYSAGMPSIGTQWLKEKDMWGATPLDQLWCRIAFRKLRYEGDFTPPTTDWSLVYPGFYGGMNWGSASVDERRDLLIFNDIRMPTIFTLIPRKEMGRENVAESYGGQPDVVGHGGLQLQEGTPFGAYWARFMSPIGVPCQAPPYGTLTAIDLSSRTIAWQRPLGTVRDTGPLGIKMGLPIPIGMPSTGGAMTTGSGLVFFAGTLDYYLRAFDSRTGDLVWKSRLPVGADATPMSYVSPESGRQFVLVSASGSRDSPDRGDYIIAFALPDP